MMFLALAVLLGGSAPSQTSDQIPAPAQRSEAFDDYGSMLKQLGIKQVRRGPDPNNQSTFDEAASNPYASSMPDVLRLKNGSKVSSPAQWVQRRKEIEEDFAREVYGRVPKHVPNVTWELVSVEPGQAAGIQTVTKKLVGHVDNRAYPAVSVDIQASYTVPVYSAGKVPIIVEFGGFRPRGDHPWTEQAIEHGWGYGSINPNSVQPDNAQLNKGIIGLVNRGRPRKPDDWGALRAWAWGLSKLIDYFEQTPDSRVNPRQVGIEGVSRYGKAAVVAEAFDQRIAIGFIGSSGEGGTKLHRHVFGEAVENLAGGEFYWMAGNFIKYGADGRTAADIPVDSHELIALCAPRPVLISHGVVEKGDAKWIDARGSWMAGVLATPAYRLLGKTGFGSNNYLNDEMPPVGQLVGGELAWRQHEGGHEVTPNWPTFFEWAGKYVPAPTPVKGGAPYRVLPDQPTPRSDANSKQAHLDLLKKAKSGGIDVYFEGDSITRRWGCSDAAWAPMLANWKENFFGWNAADFGWGADSVQHILWRLRNGELDGVNPRVIVLLAGTNNVGANSPDEIAKGIKEVLETCRLKAPNAAIILTAIFPRNDRPGANSTIDAVNQRIAHFADGRKVRFLNIDPYLAGPNSKLLEGMTVDNLHPSVKGYQVWADHLKPILRSLLGPPATTDHAPPPTGDPGIKA